MAVSGRKGNAGGLSIVSDTFIDLSVALLKQVADLEKLVGGPRFQELATPFELPVFSDCHDRASAAARALVELAAMRWSVSLRCAREHCVSLMPAGDWH